jgi:hypothetical protein
MTEQRSLPRQKTYKGARIAFAGKGAVISCLVRNLSRTGACLAVESPIGIPDSFDLVFDSGDPSLACEVKWRTGNRIGVAFRR